MGLGLRLLRIIKANSELVLHARHFPVGCLGDIIIVINPFLKFVTSFNRTVHILNHAV